MLALVDLLPSDIWLHVYLEWLHRYDAMRWQYACVFSHEPTAALESALYPWFARTTHPLVQLLRSKAHCGPGADEDMFRLKHLGYYWFEAARIRPDFVDYPWYKHAVLYPWMSQRATNMTLRLAAHELFGARPIRSVTCIEVISSSRDVPSDDVVTPWGTPWPNVHTFIWSGGKAFMDLALQAFPNLEVLDISAYGPLCAIRTQSWKHISRLRELRVPSTRISWPETSMPFLTSIEASDLMDHEVVQWRAAVLAERISLGLPPCLIPIGWACTVQSALLTTLRIRRVPPPTDCCTMPALTTFACDAAVLSLWRPWMPNLRHLSVRYSTTPLIDVHALHLDQLDTCIVHSWQSVKITTLDALVTTSPHLGPWITTCPNARVFVEDNVRRVCIHHGVLVPLDNMYVP